MLDKFIRPLIATCIALTMTCGAHAALILESATFGGSQTGGGTSIGSTSDQVVGNRFSITVETKISAIGGHINTFSGGSLANTGSIWGAIVSMPGFLPSFSESEIEANALTFAIFEDNEAFSGDLREAVDLTLAPGDYALLFGANGRFGTTGDGVMPITGQVSLPGYSFFFWDGRPGNDVWRNGSTPLAQRFVVEGAAVSVPEPGTLLLLSAGLICMLRARG